MKRLMLAGVAGLLVLAGCGPASKDPSPPSPSWTQVEPSPYSVSEMKDLRRRVEDAAKRVVDAKKDYAQNCPTGWERQADPPTDMCGKMRGQGRLVKVVAAAASFCNDLVKQYNAQVERGAESDGLIVPGATNDSKGRVISCDGL